MLSLSKFNYPQFIRFALVGASGTVVMLGTLYIFTEYARLNYYLSYAIAFVLAVSNNYLWNTIWTFRQDKSFRALSKYAGVSLFTLIVNETILFILTGIFGIWYILSAVVGVIAAFGINYTLSRRLVWVK